MVSFYSSDAFERRQFSLLSFLFQIVFIILLGIFGRFETELNGEEKNEVEKEKNFQKYGYLNYPCKFNFFNIINMQS